jgi:hypothetical protein
MSSRPWTFYSSTRPRSGWLVAAFQPSIARIGALARDRRGMSAVEFGLAAPVLLALLSPVIDLGLAFAQKIQVQQAAAAGAQYVSLYYWTDGNWQTNTATAVTSSTTLPVSVSPAPSKTCGCPDSTSTRIVSGSCSPAPNWCSDGENPGTYITVAAQLTYTSVMPYSILGRSVTLAAQSIVRVQ